MSTNPSVTRGLLASLALGAITVLMPEPVQGQRPATLQVSGPSVLSAGQVQRTEILARPAKLSVRDASLDAALDALESSSGVSIAYSPSLLPRDRRVTCACEDATIEEAIERLLHQAPVNVLVLGGQVVLSRRERVPDVVAQPRTTSRERHVRPLAAREPVREPAVSEDHPVSGIVMSGDDEPLVNVTVAVKGTAIGTLTDRDGRFALVAPAATDTLVFTALGFEEQEVPIDGRSEIQVVLETGVLALDELVVVGYAAQQRASVTGSVSTISAEDIARTSATTTTDALAGKIAGINTRNTLNTGQFQFSGTGPFDGRDAQDGRPGATTAIQIRNMGAPLFVIDGVPQTQKEFDHLNPADIQSISVLKDAAASVYGFRASNGVILVETKRGSPQQTPQLNVDGYYGWQHLSRRRSPWGWTDNAYQFTYSYLESEQNTGQARTITPAELEAWRMGAPGYESYDSWPMVVNNQNALQANINASLSGGTGDASYYLSLGHVTQDYVMDDNNFNRTNVQSNLRAELFDGFTVGTELRARLEKHLNTAQTDANDPINMHFQSLQSTWPTQDWYANGNPSYINGDVRYLVRSPAIYSRDISGTQDQIRRNVSANFWAEYRLPMDLTLRGTFSHIVDTHDFDIHRYRYDAYCYDQATDTYEICDSYEGRSRTHTNELIRRNFGQLRLTFNRRLASHSFLAVGALELSGEEGIHTEIQSVPPTNSNSLIDFQEVTGVRNDWFIRRRASYIGRINYDYQQKYLLEVLGRYDGSYLYASDRRWGFFPGVSAGWRLTEEPFLRNRLGLLNELKLRVSWGQAGREEGISPWGYLDGLTYGVGGGAVFNDGLVRGARPRGLAVTGLSWVTSTSRNLGLEIELFDHRLSAELDLFERRLTGLPAPRHDVLLPSEVGYALPNENLESEATRGVDLMVRYAHQFGNLSFSIAPSATLARRVILDRYLPRYGNSWHRYRTGTENRWAGVNFQYRSAGQFESWEEIANHPIDIDGQGNRTLLPGDIKYVDVNGDGFIDTLDQRPVGYATGTPPILSYGLSGSFAYGNFTLTHDWAGGAMYTIFPFRLTQPYVADHTGHQVAWSRWRRADPFDDTSEWVPGRLPPLRRGQYDNHSSYRRSDFYEFRAKYLRLTRIELAYDLPAALANRFGVSRGRVYVSAANPWMLDNALKWASDPEQGQCCGQLYPPASNVNVGFSATLGGVSRRGPLAAAADGGDS